MYDPTGMTAPVGNSQLTTDTVCISQSKGTKMGTGLSIEASEEDVVLGVLFGASIGFSADFEYTVTTTDSTEISGTLPGINSSDSVFQFGIAGYNYKDTAIQTNPFFVVTYWVQ